MLLNVRWCMCAWDDQIWDACKLCTCVCTFPRVYAHSYMYAHENACACVSLVRVCVVYRRGWVFAVVYICGCIFENANTIHVHVSAIVFTKFCKYTVVGICVCVHIRIRVNAHLSMCGMGICPVSRPSTGAVCRDGHRVYLCVCASGSQVTIPWKTCLSQRLCSTLRWFG